MERLAALCLHYILYSEVVTYQRNDVFTGDPNQLILDIFNAVRITDAGDMNIRDMIRRLVFDRYDIEVYNTGNWKKIWQMAYQRYQRIFRTNIREHSVHRVEKLFFIYFETIDIGVDPDVCMTRIESTLNYLFADDLDDEPDQTLLDYLIT